MTPFPPGPPAAPPPPPPAAPPPRPRLQRILAYRLLLALAAGVFVLDQATKTWISARLPYHTYGPGQIVVIDGFFNLVHVGNTGAAWSLFAGRSTFLAVLAVATLVAIFAWRRQLGLRLGRCRSASACFAAAFSATSSTGSSAGTWSISSIFTSAAIPTPPSTSPTPASAWA